MATRVPNPISLYYSRPLNSHGLTVRHTVLGLFSRSHGQMLISHCQVQCLHCQPSILTETGFCTSLHK